MAFYNHNIHFRHLSSGSSRTAGRCRPEKTFLLVAAFAVVAHGDWGGGGWGAEVQHAGDLGQVVASDLTPYYLTGNTWSILDLSASQSGYAFAQIADSTPPTFVSSELDPTTGVLRITFSETIDATPTTNIDPTKIHIRESGNYTGGGITLTAGELGTTADASTISFTLTEPRLVTVTKLTTPELTIEPGAVRDASGNLIVGTFDLSTVSYNGDDEILLVSGQDRLPDGMAFSNDGAKMFVVGNTGNAINEYDPAHPL